VGFILLIAKSTARSPKSDLNYNKTNDLVGTKQSAIAKLEDADYDELSLSMLQKIAGALNQKVEIKFSAIALESSLV